MLVANDRVQQLRTVFDRWKDYSIEKYWWMFLVSSSFSTKIDAGNCLHITVLIGPDCVELFRGALVYFDT